MRYTHRFSPHTLIVLSSLLLACQTPVPVTPTVLETRGADFSFAFSPDGERLAFTMAGYGTLVGGNETLRKKNSKLYLFDLKNDRLTSYPHDLDASLFQAWSPDGKTLAYASADKTLSLLNPGAPEQTTRLKNDSPFTRGITWASATEITSFQYNENSDVLRQRFDRNAPQGDPVLIKSPTRTVKSDSAEAQPVISAAYTLSANSSSASTFLIKESYFPDQEAWVKISEDSAQANVYKPLTKETVSANASLSQDNTTLYYDASPLSPLDNRLSSEIFRLDLNSGAQVPLGKGFMPMISPDGNALAMIQDNKLVIASPEGTNPREILTKVTLGENSVHTYQWHPDSQKLWVLTTPDQTSELEFEGKPVVNTRYANVSIVAPEKIAAFKLYEIDAQSGVSKEHTLDWNTVKSDLN
jgi:WD40 repeat protein